jgi:hypothetical protein
MTQKRPTVYDFTVAMLAALYRTDEMRGHK